MINFRLKCYSWTSTFWVSLNPCDSHHILIDFHKFLNKITSFFPSLLDNVLQKFDNLNVPNFCNKLLKKEGKNVCLPKYWSSLHLSKEKVLTKPCKLHFVYNLGIDPTPCSNSIVIIGFVKHTITYLSIYKHKNAFLIQFWR